MQELKELAALAYRDTTAENREFWKNEMGQALREIHQVYDEKLDGMRGELETFYNLKVRIHSCSSSVSLDIRICFNRRIHTGIKDYSSCHLI